MSQFSYEKLSGNWARLSAISPRGYVQGGKKSLSVAIINEFYIFDLMEILAKFIVFYLLRR